MRRLLARFFVANNISFSVIQSLEFVDFITAAPPLFSSARYLPSRKQMGGVLLDEIFDSVQAKIFEFVKGFVQRGGRMTPSPGRLGEHKS